MATITAPIVQSRTKRLTPEEVDKIAQRLKEAGGHVTFYLSTTGSFSFRAYRDNMKRMVNFETRERGQGRKPLEATVLRANGQEYGTVKFVNRRLSVPADDVEIVKAIMSHPECKGSPNSGGQSTFYLHDPQSEKEMKMEQIRSTKDARDIAYDLKDFELALAAARVGSYSRDTDDQYLAVVEYAETRPLEFRSWFNKTPKGWSMNEGEYLGAMVTIAMRESVITRRTRDELFHYGDLVLGDSHNTIVQRLSRQDELRLAIEKDVKDSLGFSAEANVAKAKAARAGKSADEKN